MSNHARLQRAASPVRAVRRTKLQRRLVLTLLAIEFLDELVDGSRQAAWPLVRRDLGLSYTEIGLLLSVPNFVGNFIESPLALLGDTRHRRTIILTGGLLFALALLLVALSSGFASLLLALVLFYPAGGAFVSLSQAALMDCAPARREQNMARWAFAGSLGVVCGSLALNATVAAGASWRVWFGVMCALAAFLVLAARTFVFGRTERRNDALPQAASGKQSAWVAVKRGATNALSALRRGEVWRWLVLLEFSDLMLDGFHGFLALYFVDVAGTTDREAAAAIAVWTGVGLGGDLLLIPLLERVRGLRYLRLSAVVMLFLFPAFLLAPNLYVKLALLGLMGMANSGWYSILKAQLYASMPEGSGAALALNNVSGLVGGLIPLALGMAAERFGLARTMWLLLAGPLLLLVAIPRHSAKGKKFTDMIG
ncbi:MAG TPA: MFS transporter [Pyrinomonadaceae bacterium]|jgi:FSR family fosmidomycin resistance protein-like MFS transporter